MKQITAARCTPLRNHKAYNHRTSRLLDRCNLAATRDRTKGTVSTNTSGALKVRCPPVCWNACCASSQPSSQTETVMAIEEEKKGDPSKSLSAHAKDKETTTTTTTTKRVELLDEDDELTDAFVIALAQTFIRFSKNAKSVIIAGFGSASSIGKTDDENNNNKGNTQQAEKFRQELKQAVLTEQDLDNFARAVNQGNTMSDEEKAEIKEYFETDKDGRLTFNGFCEMYHLQSTSQEDESWKDLHALGYDDQLQLRPDKLSSDDKEKVAQPKIAE